MTAAYISSGGERRWWEEVGRGGWKGVLSCCSKLLKDFSMCFIAKTGNRTVMNDAVLIFTCGTSNFKIHITKLRICQQPYFCTEKCYHLPICTDCTIKLSDVHFLHQCKSPMHRPIIMASYWNAFLVKIIST